jgi:isochorismate synthase
VCEAQPHHDFVTGSPFLLALGREVLIASGVKQVIAASSPSWVEHYAAFVRAVPGDDDVPCLVGALPFDHRAMPHVYQPAGVVRGLGDTGWSRGEWAVLPAGGARRPARWRMTADPTREGYMDRVARVLDRLLRSSSTNDPTTALQKVVLARTLRLRADQPLDIHDLVTRLRRDASVTVYVVPLPSRDGRTPRWLVGATPELLVQKTGASVTSEPLAGSARRDLDPATDRTLADHLRRSEKDRREHRLVVEWIADRLTPFCRRLRVPASPTLVSTRYMWHLASRIEGDLHDEQISSLALAEVLHPTPAVCGVPQDAARQAIAEIEGIDREFFAGAVGWCDRRGDGRWLLTIRCADIAGDDLRLYAGAGIVSGSDPAIEADETSAKLAALLDALGVDEDGATRDRGRA